jgi:hypothetical protein
MRFAYWTIDEVNQHLAERFAARTGVQIDVCSFRDADAARSFDAVLYDLDFFPMEQRRDLLAGLLAQQRIEPVVVHSYHLRSEEARALRRQGVIVVRRLRPNVFARLRALVSRQARKRSDQRAARPGVSR